MYPHDDKVSPLLPGERWAPHPWLGLHVSTLGRVFNPNTGRFIGSPASAGGKRASRARMPWRPYVSVSVVIDGRATTVKAHALVLETFVGPRPEGHDGDHIDHDRLNNRLDNLRWRLAALNRADNWSAAPVAPARFFAVATRTPAVAPF